MEKMLCYLYLNSGDDFMGINLSTRLPSLNFVAISSLKMVASTLTNCYHEESQEFITAQIRSVQTLRPENV